MSQVVWSRRLASTETNDVEQWVYERGGFFDTYVDIESDECDLAATFDDTKTAMLFKLTWG